jgi:hypothetical protein
MLVATMRSWVEDMQEELYAHAYRKAMDLYAVGQPRGEHLPLADERFGLDAWRHRKPEELLDGLVGFDLVVTTVTMAAEDLKDDPDSL